jgi:putative DNA primase/helicase
MKTKNAKKTDTELLINRAIDDPHGLARSWLVGLEGRGHGVQVAHHREEYLMWDGGAYREIPAGDLRKQLAAHAERQFVRANKKQMKEWAERSEKGEKPPLKKKVTARLITDVLQALAGECHLPSDIGPPVWITSAGTVDEERVAEEDPRMVMAMPSGVLNLRKAADGDAACFGPPTPHFFTRTAVGYDYSASATAPRWTQFLNEVFGVNENANDEKSKKANKAAKASIRALRQWFGYLLTADTSLQKILMLLGLPRSGKGTILRVLSALLGGTNVGSVRLEDLGSRFGLWPVRYKNVGVIADLRLSDRADRSAIVERLLSVSGEDAQPIEKKFGDTITTRLPTRFVIVSNEVPRLIDASAALASRLIIIRTATTFLGKEDTQLEGKLLAELPGILLWALAGLADLHEQGHFTQPSSGKEDIRNMRDMAAPVGAFLRDRCKLDPKEQTETGTLFEAYIEWCHSEGRKFTATKEQFGRDLRANADIATSQQRNELTGVRKRYYVGVKLLPN